MTHNTPEKAPGSDSPGLAAPDGTREHPAASETPTGRLAYVGRTNHGRIVSLPAASETPQDARERRVAALRAVGEAEDQDAREVERRERWADRLFGSAGLGTAWSPVIDTAIAEADREQAALFAERDVLVARSQHEHGRWKVAYGKLHRKWLNRRDEVVRLKAQHDALQRDLAQAVGEWNRWQRVAEDATRAVVLAEGERDRLRAGIEALAVDVRRGGLGVGLDLSRLLRALLATPDADAQDDRPSMTDAASVGIGSHESAWLNDPTPADWDDAQDTTTTTTEEKS